MKYKVIGVVMCLCIVVTSILVKFDFDPKMKRYQQHIDAPAKVACTNHGEDVFCTHLPIVEIDTNNVDIPGKKIGVDREKNLPIYSKTDDGKDVLTDARIKIIDNDGSLMNHYDDKADIESRISIHIRGNSSRAFDKSGYAIKLLTEDGENNPQEVMGMDKHFDWVMHGPILDKTLLRNYMWYNIAGEIMDYAPNVRFCEAFVNGEYNGVYVMVESITAGKDGARLNLSVDRKDNTYTGYLLAMDRRVEMPVKEANSFTGYTYWREHKIEIKYPGTDNITPELQRSITKDFSDFEKAIYSYDFDNDENGYKDFIDVDSFVDYFILNEYTCNYDAGWLSTFIYKDINGKYKLCIWDFNSACDNYQHSFMNSNDFEFQNCLWYEMLMKDEDFNKRIIERYRTLRKGILSEEYLYNYIDDVVEYLGPAIDRNYEKWGYMFEEEHDMLKPTERNPRTYDESIQNMKDFIASRSKLMDQNIETILQYSEDSKIKKFNEAAN